MNAPVILCSCRDQKHTTGARIAQELSNMGWILPRALSLEICQYANSNWSELCGPLKEWEKEYAERCNGCIIPCKTQSDVARDFLRIFKALEEFRPCMVFEWSYRADTTKTEKRVSLHGEELSRPTIRCDAVESFIQAYQESGAIKKIVRISARDDYQASRELFGTYGRLEGLKWLVLTQYSLSDAWCALSTLFCCPFTVLWHCLAEVTTCIFDLQVQTHITVPYDKLQREYWNARSTMYRLVEKEETDGDGMTRKWTEWEMI